MERNVEGLLRGGQFMSLLDQQAVRIREKYDLKRVDVEVLYYLSHNPNSNTARDIQQFLKINKGYISQIVDHLCKRGLIIAITDQNDRRYVHYLISEKTDEIVEEMNSVWENISQKVFEGVSEEEKQIFKTVACKVEQNIERMLNE